MVLPPGWEVESRGDGVQLVETPALAPERGPGIVQLQPADVPEMLDLVARTEPGPFFERTIELGSYLGIRYRGRLVAMAGNA